MVLTCCLAGIKPCQQISPAPHMHTQTEMGLSGSRSSAMVSPTSQAPGLPVSWHRPMIPPLANSQTPGVCPPRPLLLTDWSVLSFSGVDLHGLETTLSQGNIYEWSVTMTDCSGQAQDLVTFMCPPLHFPVIGYLQSSLTPVFLLPLNILQ